MKIRATWSAKKAGLLLLITALLLTSIATVVRADENAGQDDTVSGGEMYTGTKDEEVTDRPVIHAVEQEVQTQADKDAAAALAKDQRRKAAKLKKRTMESCLTVVRATYSA